MKRLSKIKERNQYGRTEKMFPSKVIMNMGGVSNSISVSDEHMSYMINRVEKAHEEKRLISAKLTLGILIKMKVSRLIKEHCEI